MQRWKTQSKKDYFRRITLYTVGIGFVDGKEHDAQITSFFLYTLIKKDTVI